jgi:hypothetical protein
MMQQVQRDMPSLAEKLNMLEVEHIEKIACNLQFF